MTLTFLRAAAGSLGDASRRLAAGSGGTTHGN